MPKLNSNISGKYPELNRYERRRILGRDACRRFRAREKSKQEESGAEKPVDA